MTGLDVVGFGTVVSGLANAGVVTAGEGAGTTPSFVALQPANAAIASAEPAK